MTNTFVRDRRPHIQYTGDGGRTTFPFPFPVLATDDLLAYVDDVVATGFAITGLGDPLGGEIEFIDPPAAGVTVTLLRRTEGLRGTEFVDGGPFRAAAINAELDRIMLLIQENREEHGRALRGDPTEGNIDFCLPSAAQRANSLLGFDSSGRPAVFGQAGIPTSGDASGVLVTPNGGTTARALGEHLAALVNVRDFGATGDGVTDDSSAFQTAISAAQIRSAPVYVPASPNAYLLGSTLVVDGVSMIGDGVGSILKLSLASGSGVQLAGRGSRLVGLRLLGSGANGWPTSAADVDLSGVTLDGVSVAAGASDAVLHQVEVAACETGVAVNGALAAVFDSSLMFCRNGMQFRAGAEGAALVAHSKLHACSSGLNADPSADVSVVTLQGGEVSACGLGLELTAPSSRWRVVHLSDLRFAYNLDADVEIGPRQSAELRTCHLDQSGKRAGTSIDLVAAGETVEAPNLTAQDLRAEVTDVVSVQLSGGTNLDLMQPGDLIVLSTDADDIDDLWTSSKATRGGIVHKVNSQTPSTADIDLAAAGALPLLSAADDIRVVGRFGTSTVDSVGSIGPASDFIWLRADDHARVFAAHNPMPVDQVQLVGTSTDFRHLPGLGGEATSLSGVELSQGAMNGALVRLHTFEIAQDTAVSFVPDSTIGMAHVFGHGSLGDPSAAIFTYRVDVSGYTQLLANVISVEVAQLTALTGTTGNPGVFTFSAHSDGRIYIENRIVGSPRTVSLLIVGAPL